MELWQVHATLQTTGLALLVAGMVVARVTKGKPGWLKKHHAVVGSGVALLATGVVVSTYMVQASGGPHFRVDHPYYALIVFALLVVNPLLGKLIPKKPKVRQVHRWLGPVLAFFVLFTMWAGLEAAGVIPD
ncbi:MAG: hypothetical protein Kow0069_09290 [Promethearchaeota archaeon]